MHQNFFGLLIYYGFYSTLLNYLTPSAHAEIYKKETYDMQLTVIAEFLQIKQHD